MRTFSSTFAAITLAAAVSAVAVPAAAATLNASPTFRADVDPRQVTISPPSLSFGDQHVGEPGTESTVTVTSTGTESVTFGTATITGTDVSAFIKKTDTCSSKTLAPNQQCQIGVVPQATNVGLQSATLNLPDNSLTTPKTVPLSLVGEIGAKGAYYPVNPARLLDTRTGLGAPKAVLGPQRFIDLQVTGRAGVPTSGVSAVVLNVTVTGSTAGSYLTVYPTGVARPTASSINFPRGWTGANSVTVGLGTGGKVRIYNQYGSTHVIADAVGFYAADSRVVSATGSLGSDLYTVTPVRWIDTREYGSSGRLGNGEYYQLAWDFGPEFNPAVRAVAVNITAVSPNGPGYLSAWNGSTAAFPKTSTLNYTSGRNVPNMAIVPASPCYESWCGGSGAPMIGVLNTASGSISTHLIVDIVGVYDDATPGEGLRFRPTTPTRITDTRVGLGYPSALGAGVTGTVTAPASVAAAHALAFNVTAVGPTASTFLTLWPNGLALPNVSNLNPATGQTVANAAITELGTNKAFNIYNYAGTTNVLVDVVGTFQSIYAMAAMGTVDADQRMRSSEQSLAGSVDRAGKPIRPVRGSR